MPGEINWGRNLRIVVVALLLILTMWFLFQVRTVVMPFGLAVIISYFLAPIVDFGESKGLSRSLTIAIIYFVLFAILILSSVYVIPVFINELTRLTEYFPLYVSAFGDALVEYEGYYARLALPEAVRESINETLTRALETLESRATDLLGSFVMGFMGVLSQIFYILLGPILAIYILKDAKTVRRRFADSVPEDSRPMVQQFLTDIDRVLAGFFRGRLMISLFVGVVVAVALGVLGLRFSVVLGVIAGLTNLIPYFGPIIGAIPALTLAAFDSGWLFIMVAVIFVLVQLLDGLVITPRFLGDRTGLSPLGVIFAVLAGGALFGVWGLFLGVPVGASIKVCLDHLFRWVQQE